MGGGLSRVADAGSSVFSQANSRGSSKAVRTKPFMIWFPSPNELCTDRDLSRTDGPRPDLQSPPNAGDQAEPLWISYRIPLVLHCRGSSSPMCPRVVSLLPASSGECGEISMDYRHIFQSKSDLPSFTGAARACKLRSTKDHFAWAGTDLAATFVRLCHVPHPHRGRIYPMHESLEEQTEWRITTPYQPPTTTWSVISNRPGAWGKETGTVTVGRPDT